MKQFMILIAVGLLASCGEEGGSGDLDATDAPPENATDTPVETTDTDISDVPEETGCTVDGDCDDDDPCTQDVCDTDSALCEHDPVDGDGDGYAAASVGGTECGGTDCDDEQEGIHPGADLD